MVRRRTAGARNSSGRIMQSMELMKWAQLIQRSTHDGKVNSSGTMIEAGSETTSQILNNTLVGLLSNPSTIQKCQEELDRVVGDTPPTFDDIQRLPYVRSLVKVSQGRNFRLT
jgi:cytochrome P450